jgi:hypothetical protein
MTRWMVGQSWATAFSVSVISATPKRAVAPTRVICLAISSLETNEGKLNQLDFI